MINSREAEVKICYQTINGLYTLFFFCEMEIDRNDVGISVIAFALWELTAPRINDDFNVTGSRLEKVLRWIDNT